MGQAQISSGDPDQEAPLLSQAVGNVLTGPKQVVGLAQQDCVLNPSDDIWAVRKQIMANADKAGESEGSQDCLKLLKEDL